MMMELIRIAIGIKAKTRNNCKANLFILYMEQNFDECVKYPKNFQAKQVTSKLFLEQT